jgi:DNA-directed RNA polymerase subunit RPC12/RpoP
LKCPYCATLIEVQQDEAAPAVVEIDFEEARSRVGLITEGQLSEKAVQVECATCGAAVVFEPPDVAGQCPFCTTKIVVQPHTPDPLITPQGLLPFSVPKPSAIQQLRSWLSSRWFAPDDLKKVANPERLEGMYLPFWTYDARTETRYTGLRGEHYWVQESYTEMVNGRPERRTRNVRKTRWYPAAGTVRDAFDDLLVPASRSIAQKRLDDLEPWGLEQVQPYNASYLAGFKAQRYQLSLEDAFAEAQERMKPTIRATICSDIGGDEQQIHSMNVNIYDTTFKHLLLPVWLGAYRFKEKVYQVAVNARTGEVSGERPYSAAKIALLVIAIILAVIVLSVFSKN